MVQFLSPLIFQVSNRVPKKTVDNALVDYRRHLDKNGVLVDAFKAVKEVNALCSVYKIDIGFVFQESTPEDRIPISRKPENMPVPNFDTERDVSF